MNLNYSCLFCPIIEISGFKFYYTSAIYLKYAFIKHSLKSTSEKGLHDVATSRDKLKPTPFWDAFCRVTKNLSYVLNFLLKSEYLHIIYYQNGVSDYFFWLSHTLLSNNKFFLALGKVCSLLRKGLNISFLVKWNSEIKEQCKTPK